MRTPLQPIVLGSEVDLKKGRVGERGRSIGSRHGSGRGVHDGTKLGRLVKDSKIKSERDLPVLSALNMFWDHGNGPLLWSCIEARCHEDHAHLITMISVGILHIQTDHDYL